MRLHWLKIKVVLKVVRPHWSKVKVQFLSQQRNGIPVAAALEKIFIYGADLPEKLGNY